MGDALRSRAPSDAHRRLVTLVAQAEAEAGRQAQAILDVRSVEPAIDLRDGTRDRPPPPPRPGPDQALALVLNRVRYRLFGLAAVRSVGPQDRGLTELAALASRTMPPDVDDLVRQWFARLSIRRAGRRELSAAIALLTSSAV